MRAMAAGAVALVMLGGAAGAQQEIVPGSGVICCYAIGSSSNEPTYKASDKVVIERYAAAPARGEMALFKPPKDPSAVWIKRVIGLPGDRVQLVNARLYINGEPVPRERTSGVKTLDRFGKEVEAPTYVETLPGGVKHRIIQLDGDDGVYANTPLYTVPPGSYFVLGDNRDNSIDSRVPPDQDGLGSVPLASFIGRALQ